MENLTELLQEKKKVSALLRKHKEFLDRIRENDQPMNSNHVIQFARNISYTLSAPRDYKEESKSFHLYSIVIKIVLISSISNLFL